MGVRAAVLVSLVCLVVGVAGEARALAAHSQAATAPASAPAQPPPANVPAPAQVASARQPAVSVPSCAAMVARLRAGDLDVDFRSLRFACAEQSHAAVNDNDVKAMIGAFDAKHYRDAVNAARKILALDYPNLQAHLIASRSYQELSNPARARLHREIATGLLRSILQSGDGKTEKTAWVVVSIEEEYWTLAALGLRPDRQAYMNVGGRTFGLMTAENPNTHQKHAFYFDTTESDRLMVGAIRGR
jgi:hypothetical protein